MSSVYLSTARQGTPDERDYERNVRMDFRLVYEGPLKAASAGKGGGRVSEKHAIRKVIHKQLKRLWESVPQLKARSVAHSVLNPGSRTRLMSTEIHTLPGADFRESILETLGAKFNRCEYKFVPLVSNHLNLSCGLEILFLRRDMPGIPLIHSGGDIDNRLKVLFDALRVPSDCGELGDAVKETDEDPYFFCLLEDDALITEVAVTTDFLLSPCLPNGENDVQLIIKAKVRPTDFSFENLAFAT
jgi:hypothetical protein